MTVYDCAVKDRAGKEVSLYSYEGKVLLIVNRYGPDKKSQAFEPDIKGLL
jgi:glutathione peroxidase-family protein